MILLIFREFRSGIKAVAGKVRGRLARHPHEGLTLPWGTKLMIPTCCWFGDAAATGAEVCFRNVVLAR